MLSSSRIVLLTTSLLSLIFLFDYVYSSHDNRDSYHWVRNNKIILSQTTPASQSSSIQPLFPPKIHEPIHVGHVTDQPIKVVDCKPPPTVDTVLNIVGVGLRRIGDQFVISSETKRLYLDKNSIEEISAKAFDLLPKLEVLSLSRNNISTSKLLQFKQHNGLRKLVLDDNLNRNDDDTDRNLENFNEPLPKLQELSLRRCNILRFNVQLKIFAPLLRTLRLSGNKIESVDFLDDLSYLSHLELNDNSIDTIDANNPTKKNSLRYIAELSVSGNKFEQLCSIRCSRFFLSLNGMSKLQRLNASRNNIDEVTEDAFEYARSLRKLDLSRNKITKLPDDLFDKLTLLEELDLSGNVIEFAPKMCTLGRLQRLDLSNNRIKNLTENNFCHSMFQLDTLILANNYLTEVGYLFLNLVSLKHLDLSNNLIMNLPVTVIKQAPSLQIVSLRNNTIANIDELLAGPISNQLRVLYIQANPLLTIRSPNAPRLTIHLKDMSRMKNEENDDDDIDNSVEYIEESIERREEKRWQPHFQ